MGERPTQAVIAVVRMSGTQDVQVDASQPHTANAAVVVRVGKSLLYLHELATAEHFAQPWSEAAKLMRSLPMYSARDVVKPLEGMPDPAVVAHASGRPTCQINSVADRGGQPYLRVQLGRLIFEVRDQHALISCVSAFRDARTLARIAFNSAGARSRAPGAVRAAAQAIGPEEPSPIRPGPAPRPAAQPPTANNVRREQGRSR